jgi:hypothetical protein
MKTGEVVIYTEGTDPETKLPRQFNALVLGERNVSEQWRDAGALLKHEHRGANGEPLLTLVFIKERKDSFGNPLPLHGTGMQGELIQTRVDVAHESHEYSDAEQKHFGKTRYDGGRWKEAEYTITSLGKVVVVPTGAFDGEDMGRGSSLAEIETKGKVVGPESE